MSTSQSNEANEAAWQQYYAAQALQQPQQHSWNNHQSVAPWQQQQHHSPYPESCQQAAWPDAQSQQQQHWADPAQSNQLFTSMPLQIEVQVNDSSPQLASDPALQMSAKDADPVCSPTQHSHSTAPPLPPPAPDSGVPTEAPPLPPLPPPDEISQPPDDAPPPPPPLPSSEVPSQILTTPPPEHSQPQQQDAVGGQATTLSELPNHNQWPPEQPGSSQQQQPSIADASGTQNQEWSDHQIAEWHHYNQQQQYWQQQQQGAGQWQQQQQGALQWQQQNAAQWQQQGAAQWQPQDAAQWHQLPQQQWPGHTPQQPYGQALDYAHTSNYTPAAGWKPSTADPLNTVHHSAPSSALPLGAYSG